MGPEDPARHVASTRCGATTRRDPPTIVCQVGGTQLLYDARAIDDLHAWLKAQGDWVPLGGADEQKPAPEGTVEAWGRVRWQPASAAGTA